MQMMRAFPRGPAPHPPTNSPRVSKKVLGLIRSHDDLQLQVRGIRRSWRSVKDRAAQKSRRHVAQPARPTDQKI